MMPRPDDVHRWTLYHDEQFHAFMDRFLGDDWRDMPYQEARTWAKRWNWAKSFGLDEINVFEAAIEDDQEVSE